MQRVLSLVAVAAVGLVFARSLDAAPQPAAAMVSIDRETVNLRQGASTRHAATFVLPRGYPLKVIGRRNGWLKVRDFEGDTGWVLGRLTARKPHMVVSVPTANLRKGPDTRRPVVGRLEGGEVLRTLERRGGWVKVRRADGAAGWVASRLVWGW